MRLRGARRRALTRAVCYSAPSRVVPIGTPRIKENGTRENDGAALAQAVDEAASAALGTVPAGTAVRVVATERLDGGCWRAQLQLNEERLAMGGTVILHCR
jgi:hypothetical protein